MGDGDADAEGFLDDGPEVGLSLQGGEVVAHGARTVREGGAEFLLQESQAARVGEEFVGRDGDGPGGAEGGGDDEHLGVLLEAVEGFLLGGQVRAAEDLVEDGVGGGVLFGQGAGDDGFGLVAEDAEDGDEFGHFGADEEALEKPGGWVVRNEDEDVHEPGELVEEQDVVEAVLDRVVEFRVEVWGFNFRLGYVEEVSGGYIWARRPSAKSARAERRGIRTCNIRGKPMLQVDYLSFLPTLLNPFQQSVNSLLDDGLQTHDPLLGKDRVPRCSALTMEVMVSSSYGRHVGAEAFSLPVPDISFVFVGIDLVVKVGICNVDFFRIDSDDWAVLLVQLAYFEDILATMNAVIEELVPIGLSETMLMIT